MPLASALDSLDEIARLLHGKRPVVFLDYDGTLTPIVARPELAVLSNQMRSTLRDLARVHTVAIVSGRDRADVEQLVQIDSLVYAGSHGFDIVGPGLELQHQEGTKYAPVLSRAADEIEGQVGGIEGALVERKRYAVATHYRLVAEGDLPAIEEAVAQAAAAHPELRRTGGKKVYELRPRLDWDKGKAVTWLLEALDLDQPDVVPFYLGDDETDEDAFRALESRGIGVLVAEEPGTTRARYSTADAPGEHGLMDGWTLAYDSFEPQQEGLREALCVLGNGYFATRGAAAEADAGDVHYPGSYVAGCYNRLETEMAGRVIENEDLVNVPNWLPLTFRIEDGEWFELENIEILAYRQELDIRQGILGRTVQFRDGEGRESTLAHRRLVHMSEPHVCALESTLTPENWSGRVEFRSALDLPQGGDQPVQGADRPGGPHPRAPRREAAPGRAPAHQPSRVCGPGVHGCSGQGRTSHRGEGGHPLHLPRSRHHRMRRGGARPDAPHRRLQCADQDTRLGLETPLGPIRHRHRGRRSQPPWRARCHGAQAARVPPTANCLPEQHRARRWGAGPGAPR
jgi:alpha,alpha-trehalase